MCAQATDPRQPVSVPSLVVFASGRGSNFRALCEAVESGRLVARIEALVCNVAGAGACAVAREKNIRLVELESRGRTRAEHEALVLPALSGLRCDWLVLAGYMRLLSPEFIARFPSREPGLARIVNIHPSLLPSFPGTDGYEQALRYGVKVTGATVHLVGAGLDDGPIVAQAALEIRDDDTSETLARRGLELEHGLYVRALAALLAGGWRVSRGPVSGGRARIVFEGPGLSEETT